MWVESNRICTLSTSRPPNSVPQNHDRQLHRIGAPQSKSKQGRSGLWVTAWGEISRVKIGYPEPLSWCLGPSSRQAKLTAKIPFADVATIELYPENHDVFKQSGAGQGCAEQVDRTVQRLDQPLFCLSRTKPCSKVVFWGIRSVDGYETKMVCQVAVGRRGRDSHPDSCGPDQRSRLGDSERAGQAAARFNRHGYLPASGVARGPASPAQDLPGV